MGCCSAVNFDRLAAEAPRDIAGQHVEMIRRNHIVFGVRPRLRRYCPKLTKGPCRGRGDLHRTGNGPPSSRSVAQRAAYLPAVTADAPARRGLSGLGAKLGRMPFFVEISIGFGGPIRTITIVSLCFPVVPRTLKRTVKAGFIASRCFPVYPCFSTETGVKLGSICRNSPLRN